jgi:large subunit ribosomal protein L28
MSKVCEKCGKGPQVGMNVSHSHRRTKRRFLPNLTKQKVFDVKTGKSVKTKICTKCLKSSLKTV